MKRLWSTITAMGAAAGLCREVPAPFATEKALAHGTRDVAVIGCGALGITWLIPQPEVQYGPMYNGLFVLSRRDGIVVQSLGSGEKEGYNNPSEEPDRKAAEASVGILKDLYSRFAQG